MGFPVGGTSGVSRLRRLFGLCRSEDETAFSMLCRINWRAEQPRRAAISCKRLCRSRGKSMLVRTQSGCIIHFTVCDLNKSNIGRRLGSGEKVNDFPALSFRRVVGASTRRKWLAGAAPLFLAGVCAYAGGDSPKKIKPGANPPQYLAFSKPLPKTDRPLHALDRLTFGPRPGDLEAVQRIGIPKWVDLQLHPERIPENPVLASKLAPLASLNMTSREAILRYPPPQMIVAVARGRTAPPDDPELRAVVLGLADRYLEKHPGVAPAGTDEDVDSKVKLSDVLSRDQIEILRSGKPDEKRQVLASIPPGKRLDFVWALKPEQRRKLFIFAPVDLRRELMLSVSPQNVVASDLTEGKLLRAVYSNRQLEELLVDFWYNHFNVFFGKGADRYLVPTYEREVIRPHVLGKFYDLLLATAESPAMLFYLDNWQSVGANTFAARFARGRNRRGLNENYGRELLELHTLGVDGGYTQRDVIEVARCFTGWTLAPPRRGGGFEYNDRMHDKGPKMVLGHLIRAGGGMEDGLEVLRILAHHPATAHHISFELAQRFVADDPPPSLVNRMADTFLKTDGDLRRVMETMLESGEFWSEGAYHAKLKTPFEMVVSVVRVTGADVQSALPLARETARLGEPLYRKVEPNGYANVNAEWASSAGLLERMNFALAVAQNRMPGVHVEPGYWEQLAQGDPRQAEDLLLGEEASPQTQAAIQQALQAMPQARPEQALALVAGLTLGSPEFQKR